MTRLAFLLLPVVLACSSAPPPFTSDAGAPHDGSGGADAPTMPDSPPPEQDASLDTGGDAALDPLVAHPPAGSTKCGFGAINASTAQTVCTKPSMLLDDMLLPDGTTGAMPRSCSALTIGDGEWQVWCTSNSVYVWANIPITNANVLLDCHGLSLLMIDEGLYESGNSGGNGAYVATYDSNGFEIAGTPPGDPQTVIASLTLPTNDSTGTASLWVAGSLESSCNGGGLGPPTVLTGFDTSWTR